MKHPVLHVGRYARVVAQREHYDGRTFTPRVWHVVQTIDGPRHTMWSKRPDGSWWSLELGPEWWI